MKKVFYVISFLIFVFVGECIIRVDRSFDPFNNAPKKINMTVETSSLKDSVEDGTFQSYEDQYRIMVLGDSYIHGGGIDPTLKFSKMLKIELLKDNSLKNKTLKILDVSRPSNNILDSYNSYSFYQQNFKPHVVILGYNFNDILGQLKIIEVNKGNGITPSTKPIDDAPPEILKSEQPILKKLTKKLYQNFKLGEYLSTKIQKFLKLKGIVLPFGEFYYLTCKAYLPQSQELKDLYNLFDKMISECSESQVRFIVYKFPEFNLINRPELFTLVDTSLEAYFEDKPSVTYIDGIEQFNDGDGSEYIISKHDGHPNENAHAKIAAYVASTLKEY